MITGFDLEATEARNGFKWIGLQHILENIVSILRMSTKTRNADILVVEASAYMYEVCVFFGRNCL